MPYQFDMNSNQFFFFQFSNILYLTQIFNPDLEIKNSIKLKIKTQIFSYIHFFSENNLRAYRLTMSYIKTGKTADQIQTQLEQTLLSMAQNQKNCNYVEAQNNRLRSEQLKRDLELRRIYEMQVRHKNQNNQINKTHQQQMHNFNNFWDKKLTDYESQGAKLQKQMNARHAAELQKAREDLQKQHPLKVKQSSECLNLRKMEQHMVKQKNYIEAHKVQQRILQLEGTQKANWLHNRELKIETALNTIKVKQASQLANLQKRIKTGRDEQIKDRFNQQQRLKKKFQNVLKQLRMQQQKQVLAFRGQFKSKGGQSSPVTKSKFLHTGMSK